jgi:myosin protein heavy chain
LEQRWTTLEGQNQKNIKTIGELEGELQTMHTALDEKDKDTSEKEILINGFQDEVAHQSLSIQRLQKALENYRDDVSKLEALVTHVEEEHKAQIEQMAQDHANVVADLEMQLANETEAREEEQTDSDQKTQFINTLEAKIEAAEADLDNFRAQVSRVQDLAEAEKANREAAETEIDQQNEFIAELEGKIASAEKSLETLNIELEELRSLADSERRQRETAEQDIDDRNARIADLEIKIRDQGIQANELRSKLFEVQNNMEHEIAELKADIQARDEYYKDNMDKEKTKVSNAEQESARRNVLIAELELDIAKKEEATEHMQQEHDDLVAARDEDIARLIEDLATLETNYSNLKDSTDVQMTTLHSTITELTKTIQARDETIAILQDEAIATAEQNQSIIAEQDKKIDGLSTDLADARDEISNLTALKASLEKRVETTSTELLNIVDNHTNVLEKLNNIIKDRNEEIEALNTAAAQRTEEFKTQFEEKTEELNTAHFEATERTDYIERLTSDLEELKEAFATSQQDSADTITALREGMRAALERADTLAEAHAHRAVEARGVVDKMRVEGVKVAGAKIDLQRVVEGRVGKKGKKGRRGRRVVDSGIGVEDNEEEVFNGFGEEGEAVIGY